MRIDVKKFLFIGVAEDKNAFFKKAQEAGVIDFIDIGKSIEQSTEVNDMAAAIKVLRGLPTLPQLDSNEFSQAASIVSQILQLKNQLGKLSEELRVTTLEIARVGIFGDFSTEDVRFIAKEGNRKIQFFFAKHGRANKEELPENLIYIASEHGLDYFVAINAVETQYPNFVEIRIEHPLGELKKRKSEIERSIHELEQQLKEYAQYNTLLHHALIYKLNAHNLLVAQSEVQTTLDNSLFVSAGWIPENKVASIQPLLEKMHVHAEEIAIEPTDAIPTYLENHGAHRIGEDLVHIYDTPSHKDKDPSLWVLISFAFFFSFIVGDGGYGLIFLIAALYFHYKFPDAKGSKRRFLNLFTILCVACIAWGLLTSSFFGISLSPDNPLKKYSLIEWMVEKKAAYHISHEDSTYTHWVTKYPGLKEVKDPAAFVRQAATTENGNTDYELISKFSDNIMLELALFVGCVHILLSMSRYLNRNWITLGWMLFIIGSYLYLPSYLEATSMTQYIAGIDVDSAAKNGMYLIIGGISLSMIIAIFKNKLLGLLEIMTAVQVFSDVLSYLRLYALGLAGSIVTATINDSAAGIPFIFAAILIFIGHGVNIMLSIMSGVIHGLRLNFLEWYHYSFEGDGKKFKPLQKLTIE